MSYADSAFLAGVSVLEVGEGVAGAAAAAMLASLGATVTRGSKSRAPTTPLGLTLDRDKLVLDAAAPTIAADIVIVDGDGPDMSVAQTDSVLITITPFGLDGPRSGQPGGELVTQAASGLLATTEGADGSPVPVPGFVALRTVGAVAALAALHGLDRRRVEGTAVHVDVSAQEAVIFVATLPECAHVLYDCPGNAGSGRYVAPSGLFPCLDGLVRIAAIENHQWKGMVTALGAPAWTVGLEDRPARAEHAHLITTRVTEWTRGQQKAHCADLLQSHGVPATPVNTPSELLTSPQFLYRGSLVATQLDGRAATVLGPPWRPERAAVTLGQRSGHLADLRVTELTHVLAGPIVGSLLGAMGATVTRLEDPDRLDIYRRSGPFAGGKAGVERGAYFTVANHSKRSALINPAAASEHVGRWIASSDVVIENVGQSRLDRLDVKPARLAQEGRLTMRVSGFGSDGPLSQYRVYANNVQAYGGLADLTRDGDGAPARLGTTIADPLSSVVAATVIAAWALGPARDTGAVVDLSMAEVVASTVAEYVAAASMGEPEPRPAGERRVHKTADDKWLAVELLDRQDRQRFAKVLGGADLSTFKAADVLPELHLAGVRAALVSRGRDLVAEDHLAARGFFPEIVHPDPELGTARLVGLPWRFAGEGSVPLVPPPALGSCKSDPESRFNDAR